MKKLIFLSLLVALACNVSAQKISGVVTYYFNEYQGDKADIGAEVYIVNVNDADSLVLTNYYNYNQAKIYRVLIKSRTSTVVQIKEYRKKLTELNATKKAGFDTLAKRAFKSQLNIQYNKSVKKVVVNATGSYEASVPVGEYLVMIISNNRTYLTITEIDGQMFMERVAVGNGEEKNVSHKFSML